MEAIAGIELMLLLMAGVLLLACAAVIGVVYRALQSTKTKLAGSMEELAELDSRLADRSEELSGCSEKLAEFQGLHDAQLEEVRLRHQVDALRSQLGKMQEELQLARKELQDARREMVSVEESISMQEFGVYHPKYDFITADEYALRLSQVRAQIKIQIKNGTACVCSTEWNVEGSRRKGEQMTKKQIKLMLRAFNGESDAAIARVKFSNADAMERRVQRAFTVINKLGATNKTQIRPDYLALKLSELELVHEHAVKKQEERETARAAAARLREEERAAKEIIKISSDAEREGAVKQSALDQARTELVALHGATLQEQRAQAQRLEAAVARLETELQEVIDRKARAISRAQLTRSGWVYVLSNTGSFGADVYKIGLTRRFDPLVRVKELGDASVPFLFDVHAMVFTEDAPALESALHKRFDARRVNLVNRRKEYFRVTLDEIRRAFAEEHGIVSFVVEAPAPEYWETEAMLRERGEVVEGSGHGLAS